MIDLAAFDRDGFVIISDALHSYELEDFRYAIDELSGSRVGESLGELYDSVAMTPAFMRIASSIDIADVVNELLGNRVDTPLYMSANRCLMQPPHDDRHCYDWHQEVFYTIPESCAVQTWAPLVRDSTAEDGTIEVLVGSHREGIAHATWTDEDDHATQIIVNPEIVSKYEARQIPMRLGQCMFFDSRLVHRSGKNTSQHTRYSLVGLYHDVDAPGFRAPAIEYRYRGLTPREYFDKVNK